jgi:hypothetical protein
VYYGFERRDTEYCNHIVLLNLHPLVVVANDPRHYIALHFGLGWELQFVRFLKQASFSSSGSWAIKMILIGECYC